MGAGVGAGASCVEDGQPWLPLLCALLSSCRLCCAAQLHGATARCWLPARSCSPWLRHAPGNLAASNPLPLADPSPLEVRRSGRQAQQAQKQQRQQQQGGEVDLTADGGSGGGSPGSQAAADSEAEEEEGSGGYVPVPAPAPAPAADPNRIPLKLRSSKGEKVLRMGRNDPFSRLFDGYR